jgi:hypothetical protein
MLNPFSHVVRLFVTKRNTNKTLYDKDIMFTEENTAEDLEKINREYEKKESRTEDKSLYFYTIISIKNNLPTYDCL